MVCPRAQAGKGVGLGVAVGETLGDTDGDGDGDGDTVGVGSAVGEPTGDVDGLGEGVGVGVAVPTGVPTGVGVGGVPVITDNSGLMPLLLLLQVFETSGALKLGIDSPPPIIDTVPVGDTYTTFEFEPLAFAAVQPFPQNIK
ncbi:MAG TPA: hypothetical protein VL325_09295 [Pyrinomonadaceae bacterium]|nr:hypothetical protein [Pyrinomonadaceae bacterium]